MFKCTLYGNSLKNFLHVMSLTWGPRGFSTLDTLKLFETGQLVMVCKHPINQ